MTLKIYQTTPFVVEKIWGGLRLGEILGQIDKHIGETWHASTLNEGPCSEVNSKKTLDHFLTLPYLLKLIDTKDHLSIQVHPDDQYAKKNNLGSGKSECWLILDAAPGAGIYLGFKEGVSKEKFFSDVRASKDVSVHLNFFEVRPGDFFYIPAGAIHAIGKNVFLAEVQQSSGVTFRAWDWNRLDESGKARELHINQAYDVANFDLEFNKKIKDIKLNELFLSNARLSKFDLITHPDFKATLLTVSMSETTIDLNSLIASTNRPITLFSLKGKVSAEFEKKNERLKFKMKQWDCLVSQEDGVKIKLDIKEEAHLLIIS